MLQPLDELFTNDWLNQRPALQYALRENIEYREEINRWFLLAQSKGWLDKSAVNRLRNANNWPSLYSKTNEFRAAYFLESYLDFSLTGCEIQMPNGKRADFESYSNGQKIFIHIKTPLDLGPRKGSSFDDTNLALEMLDLVIPQLSENDSNIVVLSDDTAVTLLIQRMAQVAIRDTFNGFEYSNISAVMLLGSIYQEEMYKMLWAINPNAQHPISPSIFLDFSEMANYHNAY